MLKKMQDDLGYEDDAGSEECGRFYSPEEMGDVFEHVNYGMLVDEIENLPENIAMCCTFCAWKSTDT